MYQTILFDLDGTITDPGIGITNSVMYALEKQGIEPPAREELYVFIGPPLRTSFEKYFGITGERFDQALHDYRENYLARGIYEAELIPGIRELLLALKEAGKTLIVATGKPTPMAEEVLRAFDVLQYFDFVSGPDLTETVNIRKSDAINYALSGLGVTDKGSCLMIGDRDNDILGAKGAGVASAGVLWGYGDRQELSGAGADFILERPGELLPLILN